VKKRKGEGSIAVEDVRVSLLMYHLHTISAIIVLLIFNIFEG
jgi:hypothetical protein